MFSDVRQNPDGWLNSWGNGGDLRTTSPSPAGVSPKVPNSDHPNPKLSGSNFSNNQHGGRHLDYGNLERGITVSRMRDNLSTNPRRAKVRASIPPIREYRPLFTDTISLVQLILFILEYYLTYKRHGWEGDEAGSLKYIRVNKWVLVSLGARFYPCMRQRTSEKFVSDLGGSTFECLPGMDGYVKPGPGVSQQRSICSLESMCGFGKFLLPKQVYRFFTATLLHMGVIHFLFNIVLFQRITIRNLEQDIGNFSLGFIYIMSGIGGFLFNPTNRFPFNTSSVISIGASGSIIGCIATILIDLLFSWRLIERPLWELTKLLVQILITFVLGYSPGIDNISHVGGLITGLLASIIVLPSVYFGSWDRIGKCLVKSIAPPLLLLYLVLSYIGFSREYHFCRWCWYLNCMDFLPWCRPGGTQANFN